MAYHCVPCNKLLVFFKKKRKEDIISINVHRPILRVYKVDYLVVETLFLSSLVLLNT